MRKFGELSKSEKIVIIQQAQYYFQQHADSVLSQMDISEFYEEPPVSIRLRPDKWETPHWSWYANESTKNPKLFDEAETYIPFYKIDRGIQNTEILWFSMVGMGLALLIYWFLYHP